MFTQVRIDGVEGSHPQMVVSIIPGLEEFQIEQGRGKGECDMRDRDNDVISISYDQAVKLAHEILKLSEDI